MGATLRVSEDTTLVARLRSQRLAEVLQAPSRGRQSVTGRPRYIINVYVPMLHSYHRVSEDIKTLTVRKRVQAHPVLPLASIAEAALTEWTKQKSRFSKNVEQEIVSLESQLSSTKDRNEKKCIADALQTALHADERTDTEIAKRVYAPNW